jgi:hypothetical protein
VIKVKVFLPMEVRTLRIKMPVEVEDCYWLQPMENKKHTKLKIMKGHQEHCCHLETKIQLALVKSICQLHLQIPTGLIKIFLQCLWTMHLMKVFNRKLNPHPKMCKYQPSKLNRLKTCWGKKYFKLWALEEINRRKK